MEEYALKLSKPAVIRLETADGSHMARVDVYQARRFLEEAAKQPSEEKRWQAVTNWLAGKLGCSPEQLAENLAWEFHECVAAITKEVREQITGKSSSIVSSRQLIQESQTDSLAGQLS